MHATSSAPSAPSVFSNSRMPLYLQVAKLARRKIELGEWALGAQIPTLDALSKDYPVGRSTLREALGELEKEGLIERSRGRGTFVSKDISGQRWFSLPMAWADLLESVASLEIRPIEGGPRHAPLPPELQAELRTAARTDAAGERAADVYRHLRRVHLRDGAPYCLIDLYLERSVYRRAPATFRRSPVLTALAALPGTTIGAARQTLRITGADEATAMRLAIGVGDPVVDVLRVVADGSGTIVYGAQIRYPAALVRIDVDLMACADPRGPRSRRR